MNTQTKAILKTFLLTGTVYASLMAGFDYVDGQEFKIYKFLFYFFFFGLFMALLARYSHKIQLKKEVADDIKKSEPKSE